MKELYNEYLTPYWKDKIHKDEIWEGINDIPNERLWKEHKVRKEKLLDLVRKNIVERLRRCGYPYEEIMQIVSGLNSDTLTIGFARRFETY